LYRLLSRSPIYSLAILLGFSQPALAAPAVLVDISPSHSLVSLVMGNIGEPELLISATSSPHDFALRPSDASKLSKADLIFYTSSTLTPWLSKALQSLAQNTPVVELISTQGTTLLPIRDDHLFSHDDHEDHGEHNEQSGPLHDPHAWLDPANAIVWLDHIASQLSSLDSANATTYQENAERAKKTIQTMMEKVTAELDGLHNAPYIVFHDSYQYFEARFKLQPKASISLGDGTQPGISQIRKLQAVLKSSQARCVFSEPQFSDRLVNTVVSRIDIKTTQLDPLGVNLENGESLYTGLIENLSFSLSECLVVK
jgi:zinc transport system substrate-binding protein